MPAKRRREADGAVDETDELHVIPQRIVARRRKSRTRTVTTLPDHVRTQLVQAFSNVDIEGDGRVNRFKLIEIVREAYRPTDTEVGNVELYLKQLPGCGQLFVEEQHEVSFENFEAVFAAVVLPSIGGDRMQLGWEAIKGIFNTTITQLARHAQTPRSTAPEESSRSCITQLYGEELQSVYEAVVTSLSNPNVTNFVRELVRQAFILPKKKLDQLTAFFNTSKDNKVELEQFVRGMTLLYGDMQLLLTRSEGVSACPIHTISPDNFIRATSPDTPMKGRPESFCDVNSSRSRCRSSSPMCAGSPALRPVSRGRMTPSPSKSCSSLADVREPFLLDHEMV